MVTDTSQNAQSGIYKYTLVHPGYVQTIQWLELPVEWVIIAHQTIETNCSSNHWNKIRLPKYNSCKFVYKITSMFQIIKFSSFLVQFWMHLSWTYMVTNTVSNYTSNSMQRCKKFVSWKLHYSQRIDYSLHVDLQKLKIW